MIELNKDTQLGTLLENQFHDRYYFSVNRNNFEQIDYQTQFNKEFEKTFSQQDTLYIINGTDSGMMVKQLFKTPPEKGSAYLFIDFPEIIELTKEQFDISEHKRIIVTTEDKWEEEAKKIGLDIYFIINRVKRVKSFAAQYYYLGEYLFLEQALQEKTEHLIWQFQSQLGSKTFVQRQLENLSENHTPALLLKDSFKGKSALILAGGPSLDNYIDWIEKNQQYYVVIAVSRIARRLLETNIKPDIFVSVDPHPSNFNVSKEVFSFENDSLLVHQYHVSPMLLGNWLGRKMYLGSLFPWSTALNQVNFTGIGPTVTNTAIQLAMNMGIQEQILFGVDLCYSPEGYTHAKNSSEHDAGPDLNSIAQTVITNKGDKAETNSAYFDAISVIEQLAELAKENNGQLINPSPDSTKMNHVEHILISDIKVNKEKFNISQLINKKLNNLNSSDLFVKHYQEVLKELNTSHFKINKIKELARKGLESNKLFFADNNPTENFKFKLKMDKLEKELDSKNLKEMTELAKKFGINEFLYFLSPDSDREWSNEEIKKSGDTYYKALKMGVNELSKHIFTAINRIEMRLLENNKLITNDELINRHLQSFNRSYLLDRKIDSQRNIINKSYNKQSIEKKKINKIKLDNLIKNKQEKIINCKTLSKAYHNKDMSLGTTEKTRKQAIAFYLLLLQNNENYQTRRLYHFEKNNQELFYISDDVSILNNFPSDHINQAKKVNNTIEYQVGFNSSFLFQKQIENITENKNPAIILKDYFQHKSAIILLNEKPFDQHIPWIEKNQEHFIIIVSSEAVNKLSETNIKPDIIIAINPATINTAETKEFINQKQFIANMGIYNYEKESILINQNSLSPMILGNWMGQSFYLDKLFPWDTKYNIENLNIPIKTSDSTPKSNTNTSISLAIKIGIKQQVVFGMGTDKSSHKDIEELKTSSKKLGCELITPSYSNLKHNETHNVNIPKQRKEISTLVKSEFGISNYNEGKIHHYKNILDELKRVQTLANEIKTIANDCLKLLSKHFDETVQQEKINSVIEKLESKLNHKNIFILTNLSMILGNQNSSHKIERKNNTKWTDNEIKNSSRAYFTTLKSGEAAHEKR